jgi:hypothetical protein
VTSPVTDRRAAAAGMGAAAPSEGTAIGAPQVKLSLLITALVVLTVAWWASSSSGSSSRA